MRILIGLEELSKLILVYLLSLHLGFAWWVFLVWLFAPDLSMLGYLLNNRFGAWLYNLFHHQSTAILVGAAGFYYSHLGLELASLVLLGHCSLDRMLGFGLKYEESFHTTHLGRIGNKL